MENLNEFNFQFDIELIKEKKNLYDSHGVNRDNEITLICQKENLIELLTFLKESENLRFKILADICGIDYLYRPDQSGKRFCVIYNLLSVKFNKRIFVKVFTNEAEKEPENVNHLMNYEDDEILKEKDIFRQENFEEKETNGIPSVHSVFSSALWLEREVYDMFGILISNMKDPRRILSDYGFQGFPLRKTFPLSGYQEVQYDSSEQKVLYKKLELDQEYRNFDFESAWKGPENQSFLKSQLDEKKN